MTPIHLAAHLRTIALAFSVTTLSFLLTAAPTFAQLDEPQPVTNELTVSRFVAEPDLVTPTGIAVALDGRVFVIECHSHFRPDDYEGPETDRIRVYIDEDKDGTCDSVSTFYEGTLATMNLAIAPDQSLLVATRNQIFRLRDTDSDGRADERTDLAWLETEGNYPHNGLSGFAFDLTGNIYFGFGENLGAPYDLIAADGTRLSGGGEGGSVYRIGPDGKDLQRWATGFWNPFHLATDDFGRLFVVDNDPDWRPPCRLLHLVRGGDYGYRFTLGRRGTHPFTSWFGDAPDRLGMVAGTGEAPSGLVSYRGSGLPDSYQGTLLATSWGLHTLEQFRLEPQGATWTSDAQAFVKGGEDFRPVGIAIAPDGSLYVSDWVKRSYPLHGHGRVWNVRSTTSPTPAPNSPGPWTVVSRSQSRELIRQALTEALSARLDMRGKVRELILSKYEEPWRQSLLISQWLQVDGPSPAWRQTVKDCLRQTQSADLLVALASYADTLGWNRTDALQLRPSLSEFPEAFAEWTRRTATHHDHPSMTSLLNSEDKWLRAAAIARIAEVVPAEDLFWDISEPDRIRVGVACVMARQNTPSGRANIDQMLSDLSDEVRWVALRWIGEAGLAEFEPQVRAQLQRDNVTSRQFEAVLATLDLLQGRKGAEFEQQQMQLLGQLASSEQGVSAAVRQLALRKLVVAALRDRATDLPKELTANQLSTWMQQAQPLLRTEALRAFITFHAAGEGQGTLRDFANDTTQPIALRQEAILGLQDADLLLEMITGQPDELSPTVLTQLASLNWSDAQRAMLRDRLDQSAWKQPELSPAIQRLVGTYNDDRPNIDQIDDWNRWAAKPGSGDIELGERIFFSPLARCGSCHQVNGRGGRVGPDLSQAGQMGTRRLLESVLQPSREIAPRYTPWVIETDGGELLTGLLETERGGDQFYVDAKGETFTVNHNDVLSLVASDQSLMPADLLNPLTRQEIEALLAYLKRLQ